MKKIGVRFYGMRNLNVVVAQLPEGMMVQSRHRLLSAAEKEAKRLARLSDVTVHAALPLVGNPLNDYRMGSILDPEDVSWTTAEDHCSECCDNCWPDSLNYKCPITLGHPLCDTVKIARVEPARKGESHD